MADWIPPYYGKLGKKVKDLLGKTFDIKNELKTINKSANGVKLESSFGGDSDVSGQAKGTYTQGKYELEGQFRTVGELSGKVVAKGLVPGLEASLQYGLTNAKGSKTNAKKTLIKLETKYSQPFYSVAANVAHNLSKSQTLLNGSAMIGFDGLSVGVSGQFDAGNQEVKDYNCGAEYTQDDLTVSLFTKNTGSVITASYWQKISGDCSLGASLKMDPEENSEMKFAQHTLTVGAKYKLDSATDVAIKGDTSGVVNANIEHVLTNPSLKLGIGASFNSKKPDNVLAADKFGICCTFGDF